MPNIEKHLTAFIAMSDDKSRELVMLRKIFLRFKERMMCYMQRMAEEDDDDFPDDLLHDMKSILIKHLAREYNQNLAYATIFSMHSLEKDLAAHNRLRNKVLRPKLNEMDHSSIREMKNSIVSDRIAQRKNNVNRMLTNRETEILQLIVQGYTNKEIAEKLVISHNTVLTHRRNYYKDRIKTVSGLTFYCIRNAGLLIFKQSTESLL